MRGSCNQCPQKSYPYIIPIFSSPGLHITLSILTYFQEWSNIKTMKITVCQLGDEKEEFPASWDLLVNHAQKQKPDMILLPEMAFYPWICKNKQFDPALFQ